MSPQNFSHPLLASLRVPLQPAASLEPQTNAGDKADKVAANTGAAAANPAETKTASADGVLELRSSVGHTVMSDVTTGYAPAREEAAASADQTETTAKPETKTAEAADAAKPQAGDAAQPANTEAKPSEAAETPKSETAKPETAKSEPAKTPDAPAAAPAQAATPDVKKDETRVADPAPVAKPEAPKRAGQIAVFISRKDSKLYVRQNFAPLFDVPVTIAASDRPLGTHVFTAEVDKADSNALHWSVVSLPVSVRSAAREDDGRMTGRQRGAAVIPVAAKPVVTPDSPSEALDRVSIPADTIAKINEMLTSGGSIIVSDQGINQGETGEGTDFIVRLY
ncbi:chemotaxis protein histidine kinase CheA [Bradyrhizobium sp. F1.13.1]